MLPSVRRTVEVKINVPEKQAILRAADLFTKPVPINAVTVNQETTTTTRYRITAGAPTVTFHDGFELFESADATLNNEGICAFPGYRKPFLNNEASVKMAFNANVLKSLERSFVACKTPITITTEMFTITALRPDFCVNDSEGKARVVIEVKRWDSFMDRTQIAKDSGVANALKRCDDQTLGIIDPAELLIDSAHLPALKEETSSAAIRSLQEALEQLVAYMVDFGQTKTFGILTTYVQSYLVVLERSAGGEGSELRSVKVSRALKHCDGNILGRFFRFVKKALETDIDKCVTPTYVTIKPVTVRMAKEPPVTRSQAQKNRGTKSSKEPASEDVFRLERSLGLGRSGAILRVVGAEGVRAVKVMGGFKGELKKQIRGELENEVEMYKLLRELQGTVLPRFHRDGRFNGARYCVLMEAVDADRLDMKKQPTERKKDLIIAALDQIHARGILHKDVRAPNILVHQETDRVCFVDFGFSGRSNVPKDFEDEKETLRKLLGRP